MLSVSVANSALVLTEPSNLPSPLPLHQKPEANRRPEPVLPSDKDPRHTYGLPGSHRSAQTVREKGPIEAPIKHLVQARLIWEGRVKEDARGWEVGHMHA